VTDVIFQGGFKRVIAVSDSMPPVQMILRVPSQEGIRIKEHVDLYCRPVDLVLLSE
jgi:hypothetical protein